MRVINISKGKFLESIDYLERSYLYKRQVFDATSPQISQAYETVVTKYNVLGMKFLSEGSFSHYYSFPCSLLHIFLLKRIR